MNTKHLVPIFSLALLILLAGCTGNGNNTEQTGPTTGPGLTVSIESASNEYYTDSGDNAVFRIDLQNIGERTATNIRTELFGASWVVDNAEVTTAAPGQLRGTSTQDNVEGERANVVYEVPASTAPVVSGTSQDFTAGTKITYSYSTEASTMVTLLGSEQYRDQNPSPSQVATDVTAGPLDVEILRNSPVRAYDGRQISIPVRITNAGSGNLESAFDVTVSVDGNELGCSQTGVEFINEERQLFCSYTVEGGVTQRDISVQVTVDNYNYTQRAETSFTVHNLESGS